VLSTCSSLIAIVDDGDSQVVQFSHFSVKEFLTSNRLVHSSEDVSRYHILFEPAHTLLAQACLSVLLRFDDSVNQNNAVNIPLAEYAARYWVDHAQFDSVSSRIQAAMEVLFDADKPYWAAWILVHDIDVRWGWYSPNDSSPAFPLYYAALCGLYDLVDHLVGKYPEHVNATGGLLVTPLVVALHRKHFQVAELLLRHGADIDVRGDEGNTPLTTASTYELPDTVQWLLDHGANVSAEHDERYTSLPFAAFWGHLRSVQALLEHGANINARNKWGEVPLHLAASSAREDRRDQLPIMQLLLDSGTDVNTQDDGGSTPLHHSSSREQGGVAFLNWGAVEGSHLLLRNGADIDAKDKKGRTPLQRALARGRHEIAKFLSEYDSMRSD
jgi:ankyrin repeat protein